MSTINFDNIARSIAVVSDTHFGSYYALWPDDDVWTNEGNNLTAMRNPGQMELARSWNLFLGVCDKFRVDTVFHLGDACQGCNYAEGGKNTITPDMDYQVDAAVAAMKPLVKDRIYHQVSGTLYHKSRDVRIHKNLVRDLKPYAKEAHFHNMVANLAMKGTKKTFNLAHEATSAMIYPSTVLDRERLFLKLAEARGQLPHIDAFFRGHLHFYFHLDYEDMHILQCPCWMVWFPLKDKVRLYGKFQPDIGGLIILIDKQNRMIPFHFIYPCPHILDMVKTG